MNIKTLFESGQKLLAYPSRGKEKERVSNTFSHALDSFAFYGMRENGIIELFRFDGAKVVVEEKEDVIGDTSFEELEKANEQLFNMQLSALANESVFMDSEQYERDRQKILKAKEERSEKNRETCGGGG